MTDHAEVMRIAEGLDAVPETGADPALIQEAADALRRQSAEIERLRAELEAVRKQEPVARAEMLADAREVFDANGSETPQVVRDVIEYVASWGDVYADKSRAAGAQPATPSAPEVTDAMALAFHGALTDGGVGVSEVEEIKVGLRAALAAAPETPRRGPLTDEQIDAIMPNPSDFGMCQPPWSGSDITILRAMARAVEAAHEIKENSND